MTPAHPVSIRFPLRFTAPYRSQRSHKCAQSLQLCRSMPSLPAATGFPRVLAITISARMLRSHPPSSSFFQLSSASRELQFLIQNT